MDSTDLLTLADDRLFGPDSQQKDIAQHLYNRVADLPLICPHGHVDPAFFAADAYHFGSPVDLLLIPDHYIFRMLYSQGIPLEDLGIPQRDGQIFETDHRKIWQLFADHFYLFSGTPTGIWLTQELYEVFGVRQKVTSESAQAVYDQIAEKLADVDFTPRRLYQQFNIEVLCTTDGITEPLAHHAAIRQSGWEGDIRPTFRPDAVVNLDTENWIEHINRLSDVSGIAIMDYASFIAALEDRRAYFKEYGAVATDHATLVPFTGSLSYKSADEIFQHALKGNVSQDDVRCFTGHMLIEMARMSVDDGLVMQLHAGSWRNHNPAVFERFGKDMGADIPIATEYTRNLQPLLEKFGNNPKLTLVLFGLDESTYSRELAPLAGHYPALKIGPPWWFFDSLNGIARFFDMVSETAGIYNMVGFNDDTRAFPSIPARHDLWRRASANWLAGLVVRKIIDRHDAERMCHELAYDLAKKSYKFT